MRIPSDLPGGPRRRGPRGPRGSRPAWASKGRLILVAIAVVLVVLFLSARTLANFYVDLLWFDSVERTDVFWTTFLSKVVLGLVFAVGFAVLCFVSLTIAQRLAPSDLPTGPEREIVERYRTVVQPRSRLLRIGVAILFGLFVGLPAMSQWR
ncbi:MAG: UPF0182 family protein, partial [Ilumatobacteraceae bacterium]